MRQPTLTAILALLLLVTQTATALHGADHSFHKHQAYCDSFNAAGHNAPHCYEPASVPAVIHVTQSIESVFYQPTLAGNPSVYRSRAPPYPSI